MINDSSTNDEWISAPTRLVGLRVSVQEHSQFYAGKVVRYTTATGQHTVLYDSGEEKVHDMHKKTFRIVSISFLVKSGSEN